MDELRVFRRVSFDPEFLAEPRLPGVTRTEYGYRCAVVGDACHFVSDHSRRGRADSRDPVRDRRAKTEVLSADREARHQCRPAKRKLPAHVNRELKWSG